VRIAKLNEALLTEARRKRPPARRGAPRAAERRHLEIAALAHELQTRTPELYKGRGGKSRLYQETQAAQRKNVEYDTVAAAVRKYIHIFREDDSEDEAAGMKGAQKVEDAINDALAPAFASCGVRHVRAGIRK
jgi:hypothetical protein